MSRLRATGRIQSLARVVGPALFSEIQFPAISRSHHMTSTVISNSPDASSAASPAEFDILILGGGTGSTVAAWAFAGEGKRVAVVDRKYIGGSCPNIACLPSKNVIHSAKVVDYFRRAKEFGITCDGFP